MAIDIIGQSLVFLLQCCQFNPVLLCQLLGPRDFGFLFENLPELLAAEEPGVGAARLDRHHRGRGPAQRVSAIIMEISDVYL